MNIYAIHREKPFTTEYNVMVYSSKKVAESKIKEANEEYRKWSEIKKHFYNNSSYSNINFLDFIYSNPTPDRYRIEKIKVLKQ